MRRGQSQSSPRSGRLPPVGDDASSSPKGSEVHSSTTGRTAGKRSWRSRPPPWTAAGPPSVLPATDSPTSSRRQSPLKDEQQSEDGLDSPQGSSPGAAAPALANIERPLSAPSRQRSAPPAVPDLAPIQRPQTGRAGSIRRRPSVAELPRESHHDAAASPPSSPRASPSAFGRRVPSQSHEYSVRGLRDQSDSMRRAGSVSKEPPSPRREKRASVSFGRLVPEEEDGRGEVDGRIRDARERKEEADARWMEQMVRGAARTEEKRAQAHDDRWTRQRREIGTQRCSLWLHMLICAAVPTTLHRMGAERRALHRLRQFMLPCLMLWRFRKRQRGRRARVAADMQRRIADDNLRPPSIRALKQFGFFQDWGEYSLGKIREGMTPVSYERGEFVMMEGDWGKEMFIVDNGEVEISVRDPKSVRTLKSHSDSSRLVLATIDHTSPGPFFGEFAVLCNEPRSASVRVMSEVCTLWRVEKEVVEQLMQTLHPRIQRSMRELADRRRTDILAKIYPLTADALRASPVFRPWDTPALQEVSQCFHAKVVQSDTRLVTQGDTGDCLYFIASGKVVVRQKREKKPELQRRASVSGSPRTPVSRRRGSQAEDASPRSARRSSLSGSPRSFGSRKASVSRSPRQRRATTPVFAASEEDPLPAAAERSATDASADDETYGPVVATLTNGAVFGEIGLLFLEQRTATVISAAACDLWLLPRHHLMPRLIAHPDWFMAAKEMVNQERAKWIPPCPLAPLAADETIAGALPARAVRDVHACLSPRVAERSSTLTQEGDRELCIFIITEGFAVNEKTGETLGEGCVWGVPEVMTFQPSWSCTIRAGTKCELHSVPAVTFWKLLRRTYKDQVKRVEEEGWQYETAKKFALPQQAVPTPEEVAEQQSPRRLPRLGSLARAASLRLAPRRLSSMRDASTVRGPLPSPQSLSPHSPHTLGSSDGQSQKASSSPQAAQDVGIS